MVVCEHAYLVLKEPGIPWFFETFGQRYRSLEQHELFHDYRGL